MATAEPLVAQAIQTALPALADHARALDGISALVTAVRGDFVSQWKGLVEQTAGANRFRHTGEMLDRATHAWLDGLNAQSDPGEYLRGIAAWGAEVESFGANYADVMRLVATFRRALMPFLIARYPAGPELELTFRALDVLERAIVGVVAAAQIERAQTLLLNSSHQRSAGRLMGGVLHALNNTMAVIVGRSQILEEQVADETQREELRAIQKIARGGAESVKRLQQYASERGDREPARLDVNTIVNDVIQVTRFRWRDDAEASGIAIDVVKDLATVPAVLGQAPALRDALVELVLNSVEAMPLGGSVTLRTQRVEDRVEITVAYQGEGMDETTHARAREAWYSTKGAGHAGLGLTAVDELVRRMGGSLTIASAPGQGTTAVVSLPAAADIRPAGD